MSFYTIFALILLPILGGFIAWAGDVIGYRLGKSRRSLFGLRPRMTARLIASFVGIALVLVTLGVAALGSSQVRDALFRLDALRNERAQLSAQNQALLGQVQAARDQTAQVRGQYAAQISQLQALKRQVASTGSKLTAVRAQLSGTRHQLAAAARDRTKLSGEVRSLRTQRDQQLAQLKLANGKLDSANRQLESARLSLRKAEEQVATLNASRQELEANEVQLQHRRIQLESENATLQTERDRLNRVIDGLNQSVAEAEAKAARALAQAEDQIAQATKRVSVLSEALSASYALPVAYEPGAEVFGSMINTNLSQPQIEASLRELLRLASSLVEAHGIALGDNGLAVTVVGPLPPDVIGEKAPSEDEIISEVGRRIRQSNAPTFYVQVLALRRVFEGEQTLFKDVSLPVQVELWGVENSRVYRAGEQISSIEFPERATRGEILRDLLAFLQDTRQRMAGQGIRPDAKSGQVFVVPAEQILAALDSLVAANQHRVLRAVAETDIYKVNADRTPATVRLTVGGTPPGSAGA